MRPVQKLVIGDAVEYENAQGDVITTRVQERYDDYRDAIWPLSKNIGGYCSYCESVEDINNLAIEHIVARCNGGDEHAWDNFLLACNVCNSVKLGKRVDLNECHFPHKNNTFMSFVYGERGEVRVNPNLNPISKLHAENLMNLVKLNRRPGGGDEPSTKDMRWRKRLLVWNIAMKNRKRYDEGALSDNELLDWKNNIMDLYRGYGCWSVWFTVFEGCDIIRKALVEEVEGTCRACFDANNHYTPIERNPGQEDSI